jgi:hypothetical protein
MIIRQEQAQQKTTPCQDTTIIHTPKDTLNELKQLYYNTLYHLKKVCFTRPTLMGYL